MNRSHLSIIALFLGLAFALVPSSAWAQEKSITGDSFFGCIDRTYFEKLIGYAVNKDQEAFSKGLAAGLVTGQCTKFRPGEPVFLADTAMFSGLVKLRRKGETREYWTNFEAIK